MLQLGRGERRRGAEGAEQGSWGVCIVGRGACCNGCAGCSIEVCEALRGMARWVLPWATCSPPPLPATPHNTLGGLAAAGPRRRPVRQLPPWRWRRWRLILRRPPIRRWWRWRRVRVRQLQAAEVRQEQILAGGFRSEGFGRVGRWWLLGSGHACFTRGRFEGVACWGACAGVCLPRKEPHHALPVRLPPLTWPYLAAPSSTSSSAHPSGQLQIHGVRCVRVRVCVCVCACVWAGPPLAPELPVCVKRPYGNRRTAVGCVARTLMLWRTASLARDTPPLPPSGRHAANTRRRAPCRRGPTPHRRGGGVGLRGGRRQDV